MRRPTIFLLVVFLCGIAAASAIAFWPKISRQSSSEGIDRYREVEDLNETKKLLDSSRAMRASSLIKKYQGEIEKNTPTGKQWLELAIQANRQMGNRTQLLTLYRQSPKAFENNEEAILMVAEAAIATQNVNEYQPIRHQWKGKETNLASWFILDADQLLLEGKRQQAIDLLKTQSFSGKEEGERLIRLALLSASENPHQAWRYLSEAQNKDPHNPDLYTYRAKLLETVDKKTLAESEFIAAAQAEPSNSLLRDQLAEFYLRNNQHSQALQIWAEILETSSEDFLWAKAFFWNRVITPLAFDWKHGEVPAGKMKPFIEYLIALPPGRFWDKEAFEKVPDAALYLKNLQSTFWLQLLEALKRKNELEAWNLLENNPFYKDSWNPSLEQALKRILLFRKVGVFNLESSPYPQERANKETFFEQLDFLAQEVANDKKRGMIPRDLQSLLATNEVFSAAFLAAGWMEAALQLHSMPILPGEFPSWIAYELTQAFQTNRGNMEALQFAERQKQTPALSLLIGEFYIASNNPAAALKELTKLTKAQNDIGYRASWLISLLSIELGKYKEAKKAILENSKLAHDVLGKETLARIALLQGNVKEAENMYEEIEDLSSEAKSYLARKAFAEKNWHKAKQLTQDLLQKYPENTTLRENLNMIFQEEKKGNPSLSPIK